MNAAAANGDSADSRLQALFTEVARLTEQRDALMRQLAACHRENRELKDELDEIRRSGE